MTDLTTATLDLVRDRNEITLDEILQKTMGRREHDISMDINLASGEIHQALINAGWHCIRTLYDDDRRYSCYRRELSDHQPQPAATNPASGSSAGKNRPQTAPEILAAAAQCISDRAATRDLPAERSMARTVAAFNALTGHALSERDGWLFMVALKAARATAGSHNADDYTDGAAYFALAGESAQTTDQQPEG